MKKVIVISGITGMTGNELARQLLKKGYIVVGFDNFFASSKDSINDLLENNDFFFFEYDLNSSQEMAQLKWFIKDTFIENDISFINCAAVVHTKHFYEVDDTFNTNVLGMRSFLDMAIDLKANSYISCSTSEVYSMESYKEGGVQEDDAISLATAEHSQRTSYASGKLLTEFFMKDATDKNKIKGCSIRFANVYSNDELYAEHIIPYIIDTFQKGSDITLLENSKVNKRTFLHNYDSCSSVIALLENNEALDGTIYNVGTVEEISIVDLVKLIANKMNIQNLEINFEGYRASDPERRLLNVDKITNRTSWKPSITLEQGLDMCIKVKLNDV
ncbi:MAG TPA: NAD(P)-dependent oxidoreductase [Sulfurimonas autotrophica]|nr:NAD(P)-dependent oxidoreductase [Sulfurimonas autotrophica]